MFQDFHKYVVEKWSLIKMVVTDLLTKIIDKNGVKRINGVASKDPYKDVGKRKGGEKFVVNSKGVSNGLMNRMAVAVVLVELIQSLQLLFSTNASYNFI